VPVLELADGKTLNQSSTIARYLGEKFGIAGKDEWERAKVNEVVDFHKDVSGQLTPYFYVAHGFIEGDKAALRESVYVPKAAQHLPYYVKLLKQSGSGFFAPSGLTFVDFIIADYFCTQKRIEPEMLKNYPELEAHYTKVHSLPQLKDYLANRP